MSDNRKWKLTAPSVFGRVSTFELKFESVVEKVNDFGWDQTKIKCYLVDLIGEEKIVYETDWYDTTGCSYARRSGQGKCFLDIMTWFSKNLI